MLCYACNTVKGCKSDSVLFLQCIWFRWCAQWQSWRRGSLWSVSNTHPLISLIFLIIYFVVHLVCSFIQSFVYSFVPFFLQSVGVMSELQTVPQCRWITDNKTHSCLQSAILYSDTPRMHYKHRQPTKQSHYKHGLHRPSTKQTLQSVTQSATRLFICLSVCSFICLFFCPFVRSFVIFICSILHTMFV